MNCKFCGSKLTSVKNLKEYLLCKPCETYSRLSGDSQSIMVNEKLKDNLRVDRLNHEQLRVSRSQISNPETNLLDFGCGGGKFLMLAKNFFKQVAGIEITPESVLVAESHGLKIYQNIQRSNFQVVTFWHSLEHLPFETLLATITDIRDSEIINVILSVPNAQSLTMKCFGSYDSFVDEPNHTHIFSKALLVKLFTENGFTVCASPRIFGYTVFGSIQSTINFVTRTNNQLYFVLKRGHSYKTIKYFRHIFLSPVYILISILIFSVSFLHKDYDPVINLCFERVK